MRTEVKTCPGCNNSVFMAVIMPSGLCGQCSQALIRLFSLKPKMVIMRIHSIQSKEGNSPCFNTGAHKNCAQNNCEWLVICDQQMAGLAT